MYCQINVARGKYHLFATAAHSIHTPDTLRDVYAEIKSRFPELEGFKVKVSRIEEQGKAIDMETF